jgi:hypothetical protein
MWNRTKLESLDSENLLYVRERLSEELDRKSYPRYSDDEFVLAAHQYQDADLLARERRLV